VVSVRRGRSALEDPHENGGRKRAKVGLYVEDAVILLAIRLRRVHRAFTGRDEEE
jgi:hypothetical protein